MSNRRLLVALVVAVLVHGVLLLVVLQVSRTRRAVDVEDAPTLRLRLIDVPAPTEARVADSVPQAAPTREAAARTPPPKHASGPDKPSEAMPVTSAVPGIRARKTVDATSQPSSVASPLRVFNRDGSITLPDEDSAPVAEDPAAFGRRQRRPAYTPDPMVHRSPLPYTPTRFERDWAPPGESLLGEWVRHATRTTSWDTEGGTRITCSAFLFFGGCGWGPAPRVSIEELKRMRADPPLPRPSPLLPEPTSGD